jgi:GNAT superfamily N-acetyltransferase
MIFETLNESAERGELILVNGGLCHWHLRRDGQLTIREIIVLPSCRGQGIGAAMLTRLRAVEGATSIFAKCPADLPANGWYERMGFRLEAVEDDRKRPLNCWRLWLVEQLWN